MRAPRCSLPCAILVAGLATYGAVAFAADAIFSSPLPPREIKACVLNAGGNVHPLIFYSLGRANLCPEGWQFVNPLAPPQVLPSMPDSLLPVPRATLNTNDWTVLDAWGAYWQFPRTGVVTATTDLSRLMGMDVIYVNTGGDINIPLSADRRDDGLLRAVENGALLWIDHTAGAVPGITRLPVPRTTPFDTGPPTPPAPTDVKPFAFAAAAGAASRAAADDTSELFRVPFLLTSSADLNNLGSLTDMVVWPYTDAAGWRYDTDVPFRTILRLLDGGGAEVGPAAILAPYGSGAILVTSGDIGADIQAAVTSGTPNGNQRPEFRFAYNVISWLFNRRQQASAGNQGAVSSLRVPVDVKWQFPRPDRVDPATGNPVAFGPVVGAPLYFEGRLYVLTATVDGSSGARLVCLDPQPYQDLCGGDATGTLPGDPPDGNADDGIADYSAGAEYDVIWVREFASGISPKWSSPTGAYISYTPAGGTAYLRPAILCTTTPLTGRGTAGTLWAIWANDNTLLYSRTIPPYAAAGGVVCDLSTPVVNNNYVYFTASEYDSNLPGTGVDVEKTYGRAWCVDLATGGNTATGGDWWVYPDPDLDRDGSQDNEPELQRSLPCFNDPIWVRDVGGNNGGAELPPLPTAAPVVTSGAVLADGGAWIAPPPTSDRHDESALVDSMMIVRTPVSHTRRLDTTTPNHDIVIEGWASAVDRGGGCEIALVPTTLGVSGADNLSPRLNDRYYCVKLSGGLSWAVWGAGRLAGDEDSPAIELGQFREALPVAANPGTVHFNSANTTETGARQFLARWDNQNFRQWAVGQLYNTAGNRLTYHTGNTKGRVFRCIQNHTSTAANEPGVGANWRSYWVLLGEYGPTGCDIEMSPDAADWTTRASYHLPGPVRWIRKLAWCDVPAPRGVVVGNTYYAASTIPVVPDTADPPDPAAAVTPASGLASGRLGAYDLDSGALKWRLDPRAVTPPLGDPATLVDRQALATSPIGNATNGTVVAAVSEWPTGGPGTGSNDGIRPRNSVIGVKQALDLDIHLGPGVADSVTLTRDAAVVPVTMTFLEQPGVIDPVAYTLDYDRRVVRIEPEYVEDVPLIGEAAGSPSDPIAGKAVVVSWVDGSGGGHGPELHLFPPAHSFAYVPGFIKLRQYPADWSTVQVLLPDDTPSLNDNFLLTNVQPGEPTVSWGGRTLLPNGWLDLRNAYVERDGVAGFGGNDTPAAGLEVVIRYTGFCERAIGWTPPASWPAAVRAAYTPDANGFTPVPNPGLSLSAEVQQVPVTFGQSFSGPALTAGAFLLGTDGLLGINGGNMWGASFDIPAGGMSAAETLLALSWDPATGGLNGRMVQPAVDGAGNVPTVRAPITCAGDLAFVGSTAMSSPGPPDSAAGTGNGYVTAMATERTLIAAGSRIIECVGSQPVKTYTGYYYSANGDSRIRPFGHIAKASYTRDGYILVVDSGNSEVYELDYRARRVWPTNLGATKMLLNRPTDACQYYTNFGGEEWKHTVIADSGNKRIVEWVQKPTGSADMYIVSPPYVADPAQPGRFIELEYQQAKPIRDPNTGDLWGYLASAANWNSPVIVEPPAWSATGPTFYPARINPTGAVLGARIGADPPLAYASITAGATWADWSYLTHLQFRSIRQVDYARHRDGIFAWVVASVYEGIPGTPYVPGAGDDHGGVYEFPVPLGAYNLANPYRFTRTDYYASGHGSVLLPGGQTYVKPFFATSAQRLSNGDYMISNYAGAVEHLAPVNLDGRAWGQVLSSEVFRANRALGNAVFGRQMIPDPAKPAWPEPLSMVTYAERW